MCIHFLGHPVYIYIYIYIYIGGVRDVMGPLKENENSDTSSNTDEAVCIERISLGEVNGKADIAL